MEIVFEYKGTPDLVILEKKSLTEDAMAAAILIWHRRMLLRHFFVSAESKYGYTQRTKKYIKQKKARYGHVNPLVKTGTMRRELTSRIDIRKFKFKRKGRARGTMRARVLNLYTRRGPNARHDLRREITALTPLEFKQITKIVAQRIEILFKQSRARRKVKVGAR